MFTVLLMMMAPTDAIPPEIAAANTPADSTTQSASQVVDETLNEESSGDDIVVTGEVEEPEKMICRREKVIGSTIKQRICRTESQIKAEAEAGQRAARILANDHERRVGGALNGNR